MAGVVVHGSSLVLEFVLFPLLQRQGVYARVSVSLSCECVCVCVGSPLGTSANRAYFAGSGNQTCWFFVLFAVAAFLFVLFCFSPPPQVLLTGPSCWCDFAWSLAARVFVCFCFVFCFFFVFFLLFFFTLAGLTSECWNYSKANDSQ